VSDEDISAQVDRLRDTFAELKETSRPAQPTDHVTIDVTGTRGGERVDAVSTEDFLYELGSGSFLPELDEALRGAKVGDILDFEALGDDEGGAVSFRVLVKDLKEKVLPEPTDAWASEASEFETLDELRADLRQRMELVRRVQGRMALREATLGALVELVAEEAPESLVNAEMERQVHELGHRLEAQGANLGQYLAATGQDQEAFVSDLRERAVRSVKADLALRALADNEALDVSDSDIAAELAGMADRYNASPADLARQLEDADQMTSLHSDLRKGKALDWLLERVEVVDEEGRPVDRSRLDDPPAEESEEGSDRAGARDSGDSAAEASERETIEESEPAAEEPDQTVEVPS
jgi:trigger factor